MDLWAGHQPLPVLAEAQFGPDALPYQLITFLNRTLKARGLIFGLRLAPGGGYVVTIYDAGGGRPAP